MSTANPPPKRRFAPVPIETTFQSNRITNAPGGPATEPTPEPSPRSASPPLPPPTPTPTHQPRQRRRFHPQLIETSRRTRRVGDVVPATRPTDKTDITPYTNHIYVARSKHRRRNGDTTEDEPARHVQPTRRESEDQGYTEYLLGLAGKESSTQMEEEALAAFPNSRAREGGVAHFYFRESSDSSENARRDQDDSVRPRSRRKSSDLGLNWWHKHMQEHAQQLVHERLDDGDDGDDKMALDKEGDGDGDGDVIMRTDSDLDKMDLPIPPDPLWTTTTSKRIDPADRRDSMADVQHLESSQTPKDGEATVGRPRQDQAHKNDDFSPGPSQVVRGGGAAGAGFGRPFGTFGLKPEDPRALLIRQAASPPMLGKDLAFRQCPSPKQTKLETDHPFFHNEANKQHNRDTTGKGGLWKGYCCQSESNKDLAVPAADVIGNKPTLLLTPHPPATPRDGRSQSEERESTHPSSSLSGSDSSNALNTPNLLTVKGSRNGNGNGNGNGTPMLRGLDGRLRRQKAQAERDEKIASEFGDDFVTQVYNYLSLGYPATARSFDEELSKISRVAVAELSSRDHEQMAKGHMLEMKLHETPEEERCPRWKALRIYITEWALQHPNLDNLDPMAWGVRERRGSWAI